MASAHLIDDFYQGVVPALLPFLVLEREYSYAAVAGLTLAANLVSSVAQPAFGWWGDRKPMRWLIPAGMATAAVGVSLVAFTPEYWMTWLVIALSGIGISAFHPEAARSARAASGNSNRAMSIFAVGGNMGFAAGALVTTPLLLLTGLSGTPYLLIPAAVMAAVILWRLNRVLDGPVNAPRAVVHTPGPTIGQDSSGSPPSLWCAPSCFSARCPSSPCTSSTISTTSPALGGAALTVFLGFGAAGTLLGGWLADRVGRLKSIRIGFALAIPSLLGVVLATSWPIAMAFVALFGIAIFVPFAVFVILGQDYLPNRIGIASGVTVGLAVTVGGLFSPLLGWIADQTDLQVAFVVLIGLTVVALGLAFLLREPAASPRHPRPLGDTTAEAADEGAI